MDNLIKEIQLFLVKKGLIKLSKKEKFYLLAMIQAISDSGQDEKKAIYSKIKGFKASKQYHYAAILETVKSDIEKGIPFAKALRNGNIINEREYHILLTTKNGLSAGIEKIIEFNKSNSKFLLGIALAFVPPAIILVLLLFSQPYVLDVLVNMTKPIVEAGGTPPPIPAYLKENTIYLLASIGYIIFLIALFSFFVFFKKIRPKKYWKLFPIVEEEYVLDLLKTIRSVSDGGGINLSDTAKALAIGELDPIKESFYKDIIKNTSEGREKLSIIFEDYGSNYNTISLLEIGEDANDFAKGLEMSITDMQKKYDRDMKIFLKTAFWIGQLAMIFIAMKPIIDIMLLMSVSQLNFKV